MNAALFQPRPGLALVAALLLGILAGLGLTWRARPAAGGSRIDWPTRAELTR
ncbi:MAG TPA: hypothetical protein VHV47_00765 [Opitutaceae bacterium]|jgi:hypothetical protein|nr:hypothetical protein [Opitutaceae bacterium]